MIDLKRVRQLVEARLPGYSLPQEFYTDPEVFEFDLEAIHARSWFFVGLEAELPFPGSYLATTIGVLPSWWIAMIAENCERFTTARRHRGAQICDTGYGRKSRLVCPYHQWTYRLDGSLQGAGRMQESFDRRSIHLLPIHVEAVAGTIYVCLAEEPPPFGEFKEKLEPMMAPGRLTDVKLAHETTLVERANWKLVMENANECYHCAVGHASLTSSAYPFATRRDIDSWRPIANEFAGRMAAAGVATGQAPGEPLDAIGGEWWRAHRFPLKQGCVSLTMDGKPSVGKLFSEPEIGWFRWSLNSHAYLHALCDYVVTFSAMPTAAQETIVTWKMYVHKDAQEGVDYTDEGLTTLWAKTNQEDKDLSEINQRGVNGKGYRPGPYSQEAESMLIRYVDWYCAEARKYLDLAAANKAAAA
ncbi:SRPBCC family protein [Bradyrhizobium sp. sGM-13]|uniref:aromatic ring-hydroxylating oxygenase subunit alpha n=1 Tax=Bradyrhizobium sp. sGM-13 TaxID=2831781 RepID=UPI001BCBF405|nr:aromatic ring-hydroxylating dioxygenase subunit alpha [Bradyrhizobium sp. sGM-13]